MGSNSDHDFSQRTVERIVREFRPPQPSEEGERENWWSLDDSEGDDGRLVLEALRGLIVLRRGVEGPFFTKWEAHWIAKVLKAAPDLPREIAWLVAVRYGYSINAGQSPDALNHYLAFCPWRNQTNYDYYREIVEQGWIEPAPHWRWLVELQNPSLRSKGELISQYRGE